MKLLFHFIIRFIFELPWWSSEVSEVKPSGVVDDVLLIITDISAVVINPFYALMMSAVR